MSQSNSFLTTLLNLNFQEVPDSHRRKIGSSPGYNKPDLRPIWNPRLIVNGCMVANVPFHAYKARWPADGSELARKLVEVYLPSSYNDSWYPDYFPYWLEVEGKLGTAKARVVDSGLDARSPKAGLPKRSPRLLGEAEIQPDGLAFQLNAPIYYQEFLVLARSSSFFGPTFSLRCEAIREKDNRLTLKISETELSQLTCEGGSYHFMISPKEDPSIVIETRSAFNVGAL